MDSDNAMLQAALWYADLGYPVFPCAPGRKCPLTEHGLLDATTDQEQLERWWSENPSANIAIRTDGLLVVDIDGADNTWLADEPAKLRELTGAPTSLTPRGGRQYVFRQPAGKRWRNTAGQLAPHVDTRADGGYILVAPSVVEGKSYRWLDDQGLDVPPEKLPEPPSWLVEILDAVPSSNGAALARDGPRPNTIPEGQRNDTLARLAGAMRRVGMSRTEILAALLRVNVERCHPPLDPREVERIAASIARYAPHAVSVALVEDHFTQDFAPRPSRRQTLGELLAENLILPAPVIHNLLRRGETMNVIAPPKTGKALAIDTPILTESGWMSMGDLQPGMRVHAGDGSLTKIVAVSEVMHDRPCYRVTSKSGASVVADERHQWVVSNHSGSRIVTTGQLAAGQWGRRWLLPVAGPLERPKVSLLLDPWLLGYWLGNGTATSGELTVNQADFAELVGKLQSAGFRIGTPHHKRGAVSFTVLGLESVLRLLGLLHRKHIPEAYLLASRAQRAALLAGLLDADGYASTQRNGSGTVEFTTTDPELFDQVLQLSRSLGHKASAVVGRATLKGIDCGHKLRVCFAASRSTSPFRLSRRTFALPNRDLGKRSRSDAVAEVVPVPSVPVRCIQVAHPSGTFLAGRDFMVTHNSWLVLGLAMSIAAGRPWLGLYGTEVGRVLILDNELRRAIIAHRVPQVAAALGVGMDEIRRRIEVESLRGQLRDICAMAPYFAEIRPGHFATVILDALYKFLPAGTDENDNGAMAEVYNHIDAYAEHLDCAFIVVHHTTKGNQSAKSVTDVGAGAGSQARAADTHLIMRAHEQPRAVVLEAAARSWPPIEPIALRWAFPVWRIAPDLDPTALRVERPRRGKRLAADIDDDPPDEPEVDWDAATFAHSFVTAEPRTRAQIVAAASAAGLSDWKAEKFLRSAEGLGLVHRWERGRKRPCGYALRPKPDAEDAT